MSVPLGSFSTEQFLEHYWQKQPCLIRQAITGFEPLLDGDDLAGLACEQMVESRLVKGTAEAADWTLEHGPFSEADFAKLGDENWTLLVQDVEKHYAPLQDLMQQFDFIPRWRLDDLMISFAATGGSVGPHVDQYDVFLLQAEGKRRWQIAHSFDSTMLTNCPLNVLNQFEPEQEWVLEPGDMLYLPPNVAHHGIALEPGMTWSIGSRAPSVADLLQGWGEWLAFTDHQGGRYTDPGLQAATRAGEIDRTALQNLRKLMLECIDTNQNLDNYLAAFMSRFRLAHDPMSPPATITTKELLNALSGETRLHRNPWTRLTWIESTEGARLYAAGQSYDCSIQLAESLCQYEQPRIRAGMLDQASLELLTRLVNNGHFLLTGED
ncbi:MAG: cupin domain-containing protein [Xanthomonadales bacterium]|nr:cupin domain-containing protein [Xanthomonadales bacterium]MDH4019662.1 cupin domain-containing protein [Xanthomonadales bacterium]